MSAAKTCYYELLGVDRKCDAAEIKTRYRKLALQMHPDKAHVNGMSVEEATQKFQKVQEAYSVLSDAQERAWYDAHREQILRGHDDGEPAEDPFKTRINLYKFHSPSCYSGFGDDSKGFFAVYSDLFVAIDAEEEEWEDLDSDEEHLAAPPFGRSDTDMADVTAFYRHWLDFCSRKAFGHADKWNLKEAPNRQVRRAMEMENKKARQAAKKEFNEDVRQLVRFVQRRDPRVKAQQLRQEKEEAERKQRHAAEKEQRKAEEAVERKERQEASRRADEERWAEVAADRERRRERGEVVSEDEDKESEEEVAFVCEACRKNFKSEKAFDQHAKSKKHLQAVAQFRRKFEKELREEAKRAAVAKQRVEEESEDEGEEAEGASDGNDAGKRPVNGDAQRSASQSSDEGERDRDGDEDEDKGEEDSGDDDDDEDDFVSRFVTRRGGGGNFAPPRRGHDRGGQPGVGGDVGPGLDGGAGGSSASNAGADGGKDGDGGSAKGGDDESRPAEKSAADEAAAAAADFGAGKRAQAKARQRAILLEKLAERERAEAAASAAEATRVSERDGGSKETTDPSDTASCSVCGAVFASRTKLFQHIREKGHAALKAVDPPRESNAGKGRKKKR